MSADKVVQKIVIAHSDDEAQDNVEPINAVITTEDGLGVRPASLPRDFVIPDNMSSDAQFEQLRVAVKSLIDG